MSHAAAEQTCLPVVWWNHSIVWARFELSHWVWWIKHSLFKYKMPAKSWSVDSQTLKPCLNKAASSLNKSLNLIITPDLPHKLKAALEDNYLINAVCQHLGAVLTALLEWQKSCKILFGLCSRPDTLITSWSAAPPPTLVVMAIQQWVEWHWSAGRQAGRSHRHTGPLAWQPTVWPPAHHHLAINQAERRRRAVF